jgi:hypothetical protein
MAAICPAQPNVLQCSIQKKLLIEIASIDHIIFGAGVRFNAHGLTPNYGGESAAAWGLRLVDRGNAGFSGRGDSGLADLPASQPFLQRQAIQGRRRQR